MAGAEAEACDQHTENLKKLVLGVLRNYKYIHKEVPQNNNDFGVAVYCDYRICFVEVLYKNSCASLIVDGVKWSFAPEDTLDAPEVGKFIRDGVEGRRGKRKHASDESSEAKLVKLE
jgi:hypothetical protein